MATDTVAGLHRIGPGLLSAVSCHLLIDGGEAVLIDSGFIRHDATLRRRFAALGLPPTALKAVLQTHGHFDHVGRLHAVQAWSGAPAYMHPADRPMQ